MASDVAGPVRIPTRPDRPRLGIAVLVAASSTALVSGGSVLAVGGWPPASTGTVWLSGSGSTEGAPGLLPGQDGQAYLVLHNESADRVRLIRAEPGAARVRAGAAPGCDPAALSIQVGTADLVIGPGQAALLTARLRLDPTVGEACRGAVFDLPVTALARPA